MTDREAPAVWFLAVHTGTGTDVSTRRLVAELTSRGIRAEITWLPLRTEYAPWTSSVPNAPRWANVVQVNSWLHPHFLPTRLPIVVTLRHSTHRPELLRYKGLARRLYHQYWIRPFERRVLTRANAIVAVSQFVADTARATLIDRPVQVIYNGVDTSKFRAPAQRTTHTPMRLLYVGKWGLLKGVDLLAPIMRTLGDGVELYYTGGPSAAHHKADMPSNMHDIGRLEGEDSVIAAMRDADALLFPSRSEGLPLAGIEAMACGLPIVAMRASSMVEVVEDGVTGILCPPDDIGAFVGAVRSLLVNPQLLADLSRAAAARASRYFSINKMVDAYVGVYKRCLRFA